MNSSDQLDAFEVTQQVSVDPETKDGADRDLAANGNGVETLRNSDIKKRIGCRNVHIESELGQRTTFGVQSQRGGVGVENVELETGRTGNGHGLAGTIGAIVAKLLDNQISLFTIDLEDIANGTTRLDLNNAGLGTLGFATMG